MPLLHCQAIEFSLFFFNDTATTEIYPLSLHDALPISPTEPAPRCTAGHLTSSCPPRPHGSSSRCCSSRSEEHTSELQSRLHLVCRLLLEKKKARLKMSRLSSMLLILALLAITLPYHDA